MSAVRINTVYEGRHTESLWQELFDVNYFSIAELFRIPGVGRATVSRLMNQGLVVHFDSDGLSFTRTGMEYVSSKFGGAVRVPSEEEIATARAEYFAKQEERRVANEAWRSNREAVHHMDRHHACFVRLEGRKVWFVKNQTRGEQHGGKYACFLPSAFQGFVYTDSTMRESLDSVLIPACELKWEDGMPCAD